MAPLAKSAAEKALAIDPATSLKHTARWRAWRQTSTMTGKRPKHITARLSVEPVPPRVRYSYAVHYLLPSGRVPDAIEQCRLALETDPLSMIVHFGMVHSMYAAKQYREAIEYARKALEIDANFHQSGCDGTRPTSGGPPARSDCQLETSCGIGALVPHGRRGYWPRPTIRLAISEHSQEWARKLADSHGHSVGAALYYAAAGKVDAMFEALEGAHRQRDYFLLHIQDLPFFDRYRADPRYQALLQKMNLA